MRPRIYIASRASVIARPRAWNLLREQGLNVHSTWHNPENMEHFPECPQQLNLQELWERIQLEVSTSDALVLYVDPMDLPLKGAFIEAGMAIAYGKPVYVVYAAPDWDRVRQHLGSWVHHTNVVVLETMKTALYLLTGENYHVPFESESR